MQITEWNYLRNKLELVEGLEDRLWYEEAEEFRKELLIYLGNPLFKLETVANMVKEYCDCNFVYYGTVAKQLGQTKIDDHNFELSIMNTYVTEILIKHKVKMYVPEEMSTIEMCLGYVIDSNNAKPTKKIKGKVVKGSDYKDPTAMIIDLLLARGYEEYPSIETEEEAMKDVDADEK